MAEVKKGDTVITSGLTGDFPRGILIGQVLQVGELEGNLFQTARVSPVVDFGKLEEVLIILSPRSTENLESIVGALTPKTETPQTP